ncbi:MAG: phasin family protein [Pseudomonadota bacterium]
MSKSTKKSETAPYDLSAMVASITAANPAMAKAWMDLMSESARFVSARLREDVETQKAMLNCKNPAEVVQVQSEFFQKAFEQYTAEAMKMFEIMTSATEEMVKDANTGRKRGYDDVPV